MKRFVTVLVLGFALALAACGGSAASSNTVKMGAADITSGSSITVKAGQTVHFDNPSAVEHDLVTGTNGKYIAEAGAPTTFNTATGDIFNAGQDQSVVFATAGTYDITCTIHPAMQITVKVTA